MTFCRWEKIWKGEDDNHEMKLKNEAQEKQECFKIKSFAQSKLLLKVFIHMGKIFITTLYCLFSLVQPMRDNKPLRVKNNKTRF